MFNVILKMLRVAFQFAYFAFPTIFRNRCHLRSETMRVERSVANVAQKVSVVLIGLSTVLTPLALLALPTPANDWRYSDVSARVVVVLEKDQKTLFNKVRKGWKTWNIIIYQNHIANQVALAPISNQNFKLKLSFCNISIKLKLNVVKTFSPVRKWYKREGSRTFLAWASKRCQTSRRSHRDTDTWRHPLKTIERNRH